MEKNIFKLDNEQLKAIARSFKEKVEKGLNTENAEIQCIPTFITPKADNINGKSLVLDLGGTNYRVALVDFSKSVPDIHPNNGWKKDMSIMKSLGYTQEELRVGRYDHRNKTGGGNAYRLLLFLSDRIRARRGCKTAALDKGS